MYLLRGRFRRILAFLGLLTVVQITLFLSWRKNSSLFTKYFNKDNAQEYEIHILEDGNVTAYSHVVQEVVQRIGTFWSTSNHGLPPPIVFNPIDTSDVTTCERATPSGIVRRPDIYAYPSLPADFPSPAFGGHDVIGTNGSICFTSTSRYGAYGINDEQVEWPGVRWGELQQKCFERNKQRYADSGDAAGKKTRQAIVLRGHQRFKWRKNDFLYTRSLIAELSLASGGEYEVILMIQLNGDAHANLTTADFNNDTIVEELKQQYVPEEFRDLAVFFNTNVLKDLYPETKQWNYVMQAYQPVQWLALSRPQFSHFWTVEQDFRYTGHNYEFFHSIAEWARKQPRENIWERSSQFYIPAVHKTWQNFVEVIKQNTPSAKAILGPKPPPKTSKYPGFQPTIPLPSPIPQDWGVGEEADVISLSPIWDLADSGWIYEKYKHNFPADTPLRVSPPSCDRFSRRVLTLTHEDQVAHGTWVPGEATNPTTALYHGLKAVYAPHPLYFDEKIDHKALYSVFNGAEAGKKFDTTKAHKGLLLKPEWKKRWLRFTFSWNNQLAEELYTWFVRHERTSDEGGDEKTKEKRSDRPSGEAPHDREPCFPSMALHPVKHV
ncbi:hypothetical protein L207DRAFT_573723 [Hyaloscypha variabilis F]|uniref:Uncharacterized protein n=1 Tax=Hyaloscypha variabilis (strain UAMH 11265 / GT02V1 / F) TaxID=1149755 RepID=A0A2J6QVK4_HYAVF|nr:hypothetical protein L207DRAFT_573723 [Hyaloscypha variabilis F]